VSHHVIAGNGKEKGVELCSMNKLLSAALAFCAAAFLLNWGAGLLREALPVLIPVGLAVIAGVVYYRLKKYRDQNRY